MAKHKDTSRVTLTHPSGKFGVSVSARRAETFRARGYHDAGATAKPSGLSERNALVARAKELGIPAKGSNADLAEAIEEAGG